MVEYPKKKFLAMALCDVGATGLAVFGSTRTPGPYQTLLRQVSILWLILFISLYATAGQPNFNHDIFNDPFALPIPLHPLFWGDFCDRWNCDLSDV